MISNNLPYFLPLVTIYLTYKKYDEIGFISFERSLSGNESLKRITYVIVKCFASTNGGGFCAVEVYTLFIKNRLAITLDEVGFFLLQLIMITCVFGVIGIFQNIVRRAQGRQSRPIVDTTLIKFNIQKWFKRR